MFPCLWIKKAIDGELFKKFNNFVLAVIDYLDLTRDYKLPRGSSGCSLWDTWRGSPCKPRERPLCECVFKDFFSKSRTAIYHLFGQKDNPESITNLLLGYNLSFVQIGDDQKFEGHAARFLQTHPSEKTEALIKMLRDDRASWLRTLIGTRDRIIHDVNCPTLTMNYGLMNGKIVAVFPTVTQNEIRTHIQLFWENLYQAIEQTVVLCLAIRMPENIVPMRIPTEQINPKLPTHWCFGFRS